MMYKMKNILTLLSIILIGCTTINQLTVNSTISSHNGTGSPTIFSGWEECSE